MQVSIVQNYSQNNINYRTNKVQTHAIGTDIVTFSGKPSLEPNKFTKKLTEFVDFIKSGIKAIKDKKAAKAQAIIDEQNQIKAEEEARRILLQKQREAIDLEYHKKIEADLKLKKEADRLRSEGYEKLSAEDLAKEYAALVKKNDTVWASKVKKMLKDKGYGLLDGRAVKEYTPEAFRPLVVIPYDDISNTYFIPRFAPNPPLIKNPNIEEPPTRGNYSLANISVYNKNYTQRGFGQVRFKESKYGANTGFNIPGRDREWAMTHTYRPNLMDDDKIHYCTNLSYRHEENKYGDAPGFAFLIEGNLQAKDLDAIKNIFINEGYMKKIIEAEGNKEVSTAAFREMAEIIVKYLNGVTPN